MTLWSMGVAAEANTPADGQKIKHENKYSRFQIKIWAEALDSRQYSDLDTPSGYAMFGQEKDKKTARDGNVEVVMSGMMNTINTCFARP